MHAPLAVPTPVAADLARGVSRLFAELGCACVCELILPNGRRVDVMALDGAGRLIAVEIKVALGDLRGDAKWPDYVEFCDALYFAIPEHLPAEDTPSDAGLIVADRFGGAILRHPSPRTLAPARRKAMLLRYAHVAAQRLMRAADPDL